MDLLPTNDLIQERITRQLYQHAAPAIFATILNCIIVAIVFRDLLDPWINYGWAGTCMVYVLFRLFFARSVLKKQITLENYRKRLWQFGVSICLSGILLGSSGILFLAPERPAYNAFIFFLLGGTFAGAVGAFAIKRRIFLIFAAPIILPVTIHSFMLGGEINTAMATMGILFIIMMLLVVSRMHATLVAAFRFDIQNAQLARDTLRLNQELQVANDKFKRLSFYDSLTNATNRRFITDVLQNEVNRFTFTRRRGLIEQIIPPDPQKLVYGLFIVDIDHFKQINDTYGHHYGDRMLIQFVDILKSLVRKDDVVSRWGGEEFVIVLKRTAPEYLQVFAKKVIQAIAATEFKVSETETIRKTCSLGFTELPFFRTVPDALTLEQTLEIADHALYHAKSSGRNQAIMAVNKLASEDVLSAEKGAMLVKNLSDAIEKGLLQLVRVN